MEEFWALTPRETARAFEAARWRQEREQQQQAWLAWHVAALMRSKRLPALQRLMPRPRARRLRGAELARRRAEHEEIMRKMSGGR